MTKREFIKTANAFGERREPFLFLIDFEMKKPVAYSFSEAQKQGFKFSIKEDSTSIQTTENVTIDMDIRPIEMTLYRTAFDKVLRALKRGDTYLLNLTFPTKIVNSLSLDQVFEQTTAMYKLKTPDFVLFSPECFVKIEENKIFSYPMKGTIDATIPNAEEVILSSKKELWEHNTIVDLIRNDLSIVAEEIKVEQFRYTDRLKTSKGDILQVSSELSGKLPDGWQNSVGETLMKLLPAGSISGAPKEKSVEIIRFAEQQDRGYFTGIFGIFDGENLDSCVNIRYIEKFETGFQFRSGGGITAHSEPESEYLEMLKKVYVPLI